MDTHSSLRAFVNERIAWPAAERIETTGDPARGWPGPRLAGTALLVGDAGRNLARNWAYCRDWYEQISDNDCVAMRDYFVAHADLFQAHWWRTMPCDGIGYGPNGNRERLQQAIEALLDERDALRATIAVALEKIADNDTNTAEKVLLQAVLDSGAGSNGDA